MKYKSLARYLTFLMTTAFTIAVSGSGITSERSHLEISRLDSNESRFHQTTSVSLVNVPFVVYQKSDGKPVNNLKKESVALFVDDVQKNITGFSTPDRSLAVAFLTEYSKVGASPFDIKSLGLGAVSISLVEPLGNLLINLVTSSNDHVSVIAFDIRPTPMTDFTNDPKRIGDALGLLTRNTPAFHQTALFDALKFTLLGGRGDAAVLDRSKNPQSDHDGLVAVQEKRRALILVASGLDTSSKTKYSQFRKIAQDAGIPIFVIGTARIYMAAMGSRLAQGDQHRLKQAETDLKTVALETGGTLYSYAQESDLPIFLKNIDSMIRAQYNLTFDPGEVRDGQAHKIVVKVDINGDGIYDEQALQIQARQVYNSTKK